MDLCHIVITIFMIVSNQADGYKPVSIPFSENLRESPHKVLEGIEVTLTCPKTAHPDIYITFANSETPGEGRITLFDSSNPTNISHKYSFSETDDNTYSFTINRISRENDGSYVCSQGPYIRFRALTVIFSPSGRSPQCFFNYKSPVIFYDEIHGDFVFNCSTERGKPPVATEIFVNEQQFTSDLEIINETRTDKEITTYSLILNFNDTLQNSEFVCIVTQQLPSPYDDYQGSCSFGPLHFLPVFSLSVSPLSPIVSEGDNVTLTCTSNVTGVELTWISIPSEKYIITKYNQSSELTILSFRTNSNEPIFVECSGSYGSRNLTENTTILPVFFEKCTENGCGNPFLLFVIPIVLPSLLMFVTVALLFYCIKKRKTERSIKIMQCTNGLEEASTSNHPGGQTITTREETNMNNGNNTSIKSEDDGMIENIIYEPAKCSNKATYGAEDMLVGSCIILGQDHLICENVIYQSVSRINKIT